MKHVTRMSSRDLAGPLNPIQHEVIKRLINGQKRDTIGRELGRSPSWVSEHMASIVSKMGVRTTQQAVARYSRHLTLLEQAEVMRKAMVTEPIGLAEEHVNYVLEDMAAEYVRHAYRLLP